MPLDALAVPESDRFLPAGASVAPRDHGKLLACLEHAAFRLFLSMRPFREVPQARADAADIEALQQLRLSGPGRRSAPSSRRRCPRRGACSPPAAARARRRDR
jgi:hypothetical protein